MGNTHRFKFFFKGKRKTITNKEEMGKIMKELAKEVKSTEVEGEEEGELLHDE